MRKREDSWLMALIFSVEYEARISAEYREGLMGSLRKEEVHKMGVIVGHLGKCPKICLAAVKAHFRLCHIQLLNFQAMERRIIVQPWQLPCYQE